MKPTLMIDGKEYAVVEVKLDMPPDPFPWRIVHGYPGHGDITALEREIAEKLNVEFDVFEPGWPLGYKSGEYAWSVAEEMMNQRPELRLAATNDNYDPLFRSVDT